ncbi:unnamed protein product [Amoebophrya sp. A25]|nr:unnamed protein product [Amoebophrya sp. A25]|eukprot:GSA25T00007267001.1
MPRRRGQSLSTLFLLSLARHLLLDPVTARINHRKRTHYASIEPDGEIAGDGAATAGTISLGQLPELQSQQGIPPTITSSSTEDKYNDHIKTLPLENPSSSSTRSETAAQEQDHDHTSRSTRSTSYKNNGDESLHHPHTTSGKVYASLLGIHENFDRVMTDALKLTAIHFRVLEEPKFQSAFDKYESLLEKARDYQSSSGISFVQETEKLFSALVKAWTSKLMRFVFASGGASSSGSSSGAGGESETTTSRSTSEGASRQTTTSDGKQESEGEQQAASSSSSTSPASESGTSSTSSSFISTTVHHGPQRQHGGHGNGGHGRHDSKKPKKKKKLDAELYSVFAESLRPVFAGLVWHDREQEKKDSVVWEYLKRCCGPRSATEYVEGDEFEDETGRVVLRIDKHGKPVPVGDDEESSRRIAHQHQKVEEDRAGQHLHPEDDNLATERDTSSSTSTTSGGKNTKHRHAGHGAVGGQWHADHKDHDEPHFYVLHQTSVAKTRARLTCGVLLGLCFLATAGLRVLEEAQVKHGQHGTQVKHGIIE